MVHPVRGYSQRSKVDHRKLVVTATRKQLPRHWAGGSRFQLNMYYGRYVWVYELVTDADHRSEGHGLELLSFVEDWAAENDCQLVALSSGLQREDAHRFYEEQAEMERASYVYKQPLE